MTARSRGASTVAVRPPVGTAPAHPAPSRSLSSRPLPSRTPSRSAAPGSLPAVGPTGGAYALLSGTATAAGGVALLSARALAPTALEGTGTPAMAASVLTLMSLAAACLCGYLALIWALAALARGRRGRLSGRASLHLLRVLAPALARRVALGAATATAVGSLALGPALAMDSSTWADPPSTTSTTTQPAGAPSATPPLTDALLESTHPTDTAQGRVAAELAPVPVEGDAVPLDSRDEEPNLPSEDPAPTSEDPAAADPGPRPATDPADAPPGLGWVEPAAEPAPSAPQQRTITVQHGDSLWSLSDDLLGPGEESPQEIAAVWPELYRANAAIIGPDPDLIHPGQVLVLPAGIGEGAVAADPHAHAPQDLGQQEIS